MADDKKNDKKTEAEEKKAADEIEKLKEEAKKTHEAAVKALEESKKKEQEEANKAPVVAATLNLRLILVALHEKALKEIGKGELTVLNSAIEGEGGKDAKFYGAGEHLIAAIPKEQKGLDNNKVDKKAAAAVLADYVLWFVGPDLKAKVTENVLKPLEDGAEGKVADNHKKKEDIEKSKADKMAGLKYKESIIFVPSFSLYLLLEADPSKDDAEGSEENTKDADKKDKDEEKKQADNDKDGVTAQGWYVNYRLTIPGLKEHPIADAMKKFGKDLLKAIGVKFTSLFGGADGKVHTLGDLADGLDLIFGKIDTKEFLAKFNEEMNKRMKQTSAQALIWDTKTILKYLKKDVGKYKSKISVAKYALCVRVDKRDKSYKLFNEDEIANITNEAISGAMQGIIKKLKYGVKAKDVILVNNYSDNKKDKEDNKYTTNKAEGAVEDSLIVKITKPLIVESLKYVKKEHKLDLADIAKHTIISKSKLSYDELFETIMNSNSLLMSMFDELDESLLLEGHSEEQLEVEKQIDRIGVKNLITNVDLLRKNYLEHLTKVKAANKDNKYVQKILVNSKNWISKEFIGKLRDLNDATEDDIKKMLKDCSGRVGKTDDVRFELQALVDAMKPLPDNEDKKDDEEKKDDGDLIAITFKDVDDPSELSDPESPSDEDKEKYKAVGDPLKLIPGEDVKIPEIKNKGEDGEWEFMGFDPDPENMEETGDTFATYMKNGPDTVKITFYDADPETGEKLKEPLGEPIKIESGTAVNSSDEALKAFEEYNKKLEGDKKEGFIFKGWNPDPSTKVDEDTDVVAKYIEEDEKDTKYTVMFLYAPDQEKKDDVEVIQVNGKDDQEVAAGEKAERPEPPEIEGYTFKDWGDAEKDLDNVQDDIVAIAEYSKQVNIVPKAPKDPAEPDKDLETLGDPIPYDKDGKWIEKLPTPPEKEGWKFTDKWNPDPKSIKDPEEDTDIVPEYEKADGDEIEIQPKAPKDPAAPDKDLEPVGDPIKTKPGDEPKMPEPPEKDGYEFEKWDPDPKEMKESGDTIATYKKADDKGEETEKNFIINVVDTKDSENPDDSRNDEELAKFQVIDGKFEIDDLKEMLKSLDKDSDKDKFDKVNAALKSNEEAAKKIDNIGELEKKHNPYKFEKWEYSVGDKKFDSIEELIDQWTPDDGDATAKPIFNNDMKAKHTDLDFYIVPMKGLTDKEQKGSSK